jgi:CHAT domain-containing protein
MALQRKAITCFTIVFAVTGLFLGNSENVSSQFLASQLQVQLADQAEVEQLSEQVFRLQRESKFDQAIPLAERELTILKRLLGNEHPDVANRLSNLARLYEHQERYSEAELFYKQALEITKRLQSGNNISKSSALQLLVSSLTRLATFYRVHRRYNEAEPLYQQALEINQRELGKDDLSGGLLFSLNNLAFVYEAQERYDKAEPLYRQALEMSRRLRENYSMDVLTSLDNLASLYILQGRYNEAEVLLREKLEREKPVHLGNSQYMGMSLSKLAVLYHAKGDYSLAMAFREQSLQQEETFLNRSLSYGSELNMISIMQILATNTSSVISFHLQTTPGNALAARLALTTILQRKGRILDLQTSNQRLLRKQLDPQGQKLFDDLFKARQQLAALIFQRSKTFSPEQYRDRVDQLNRQIEELEDQLSRRSADFREPIQPITLGAIQQLIPENSALVEIVKYRPFNPKKPEYRYWSTRGPTEIWLPPKEAEGIYSEDKRFGPPRYAAYILHSNGDPKGIDLGDAATIDQVLTEFRDSLQDSQAPIVQVKQAARKIDTLVMQPIRSLLGNTRSLLLSPAGALNLIPFEALVDEANRYLVETTTFTYLTSGRDLLRLQTSFPSKQPPLLLGDPYFERPPETIALQPPLSYQSPKTRSGNIFSQTWQPLPGTEAEVQTLTALLKVPYPGSQSLIGTHASKGALGQVRSPTILHIATHGFFLDSPPPKSNSTPSAPTPIENPLLSSGLLLAGFKLQPTKPDAQADNGILTALEVTGMDLLGTKLIVLSACNTGRGTLSTGEGVYGLRRAFVIAGAESQLFSLWRIDDGFTPKLMEAYYQKLLTGSGRSAALRQTQLELLQSQDYNHPYYWASFIPSGNWTPMK